MKIQSDNQSPYINYLNLTLRPDIHNQYPVTVFKPNEEVIVELSNNQAKVSTDKITEYWNVVSSKTAVNDQITDSVTSKPETVFSNETVNGIIDKTDDTANLNDSMPKTAKVLEN